MEKHMEHTLQSPEKRALELIREAASEYNKAEFKFYANGFFKYVREGKHTMLIEDIYVSPVFRGTPVSNMIMEEFYAFLKKEEIVTYYGRVFKGSPNYQKRIDTFLKWGMRIGIENDYYTMVIGDVK